MKIIFITFLLFFISTVFADTANMCGVAGYHHMYAVPKSFTCLPGQFLPANAYECVSCPSGYTCSGGVYDFNSKIAQGLTRNTDYFSQTQYNACASNTVARRMYAVPRSFTCSNGYFLPANSYQCVSCPANYTCLGGTYTFNSTKAQGLTRNVNGYISSNTNNTCSSNLGNKINAIFIPKVYTCSAGYYLPANTDECRPCLKDNKCIGGTYTFNETTAQGIEPCPNENPYSPTGSAVCYPHILHIGGNNIYLKSSPTTSPALNIDFNNDGVADLFANMTTTPTYMNKDSEQSLKIMVNGIEYHVCDDTICPQ